MNLRQKLSALIRAVLKEAQENPAFALKLEKALGGPNERPATKKSGRRAPAVLDPLAVMMEQGESALRRELGKLDWETKSLTLSNSTQH